MTKFNKTQRKILENLPTHHLLSLTNTVNTVVFDTIGDIEEYATIYTAKPFLSKIEMLFLSSCLSDFAYSISYTDNEQYQGIKLTVYV